MGRACCEAAGGLGNRRGRLISQQHGRGPGCLNLAPHTACPLCLVEQGAARQRDLCCERSAVCCRSNTCIVCRWAAVLLTCFSSKALNFLPFFFLICLQKFLHFSSFSAFAVCLMRILHGKG